MARALLLIAVSTGDRWSKVTMQHPAPSATRARADVASWAEHTDV